MRVKFAKTPNGEVEAQVIDFDQLRLTLSRFLSHELRLPVSSFSFPGKPVLKDSVVVGEIRVSRSALQSRWFDKRASFITAISSVFSGSSEVTDQILQDVANPVSVTAKRRVLRLLIAKYPDRAPELVQAFSVLPTMKIATRYYYKVRLQKDLSSFAAIRVEKMPVRLHAPRGKSSRLS